MKISCGALLQTRAGSDYAARTDNAILRVWYGTILPDFKAEAKIDGP